MTRPKAEIVIVSDRGASGVREDRTAPRLAAVLIEAGMEPSLPPTIVPDERERIAAALIAACRRAPLVLTSGGTGVAPRDVTPDATRDVIDREVPGLGEAMRAASREKVPTADLSRALAGIRGATWIVNLPGSPKGAEECLRAVLPALRHGLEILAGAVRDCQDHLGSAERPAP